MKYEKHKLNINQELEKHKLNLNEINIYSDNPLNKDLKEFILNKFKEVFN
jgi:hypothetical protein